VLDKIQSFSIPARYVVEWWQLFICFHHPSLPAEREAKDGTSGILNSGDILN
jgi:hypothetical protein